MDAMESWRVSKLLLTSVRDTVGALTATPAHSLHLQCHSQPSELDPSRACSKLLRGCCKTCNKCLCMQPDISATSLVAWWKETCPHQHWNMHTALWAMPPLASCPIRTQKNTQTSPDASESARDKDCAEAVGGFDANQACQSSGMACNSPVASPRPPPSRGVWALRPSEPAAAL
jgi:hypothetical protein